MMTIAYESVQNLVGKGENNGHQHFLFFKVFKGLFLENHSNYGLCSTSFNANGPFKTFC